MVVAHEIALGARALAEATESAQFWLELSPGSGPAAQIAETLLLAGRQGDAALDTWIFSGGNALVKDVFVAGRHLVQDRHHIHEETIAANFRRALRRLDT